MGVFDLLFSEPVVFLVFIVAVTTVITMFATRNVMFSAYVGYLTLVYSGYANVGFLTGLMYVTIVVQTLYLANRLYDMLFGSQETI